MPEIKIPPAQLMREEPLYTSKDELMRTPVILRGLAFTIENNNSIISALRDYGNEFAIRTYDDIVSIVYLMLERLESLEHI